MSDKTLTPKQQRFVDEYLIDLNATQAAIRTGYSAKTAGQIGEALLKKVEITDAVNKAKAERSERTKITADELLIQLTNIATSDLNGLVQYRRSCCRHCYGVRFQYQRTAGEIVAARDAWDQARDAFVLAGKPIPKRLAVFDKKGGPGFNATREPNPKCPECFGEGKGGIHVPDTRHIPPALRSLYQGVQIGKDGLKVLVADPMKARELLMRHLGMLNDKLELSKPKARVKDFTGRKRKDGDE